MTPRRRSPRELYPTPHAEPERLARSVPALAALGLVILLFCTLPAIAEHRRLIAAHAQLVGETQARERLLMRRQREMRDAHTIGVLRLRAEKRMQVDGRSYVQRREAELRKRAGP